MSKFVEKKRLKASKRGITFSFMNKDKRDKSKTQFDIGEKFIIDVKARKMIILPSEGGMTVSKKKTGSKDKSLFDIRNHKALSAFEGSDYLEVTIYEDHILVEGFENGSAVDANGKISLLKNRKRNIVKGIGKLLNVRKRLLLGSIRMS